MTSSDNFHKSRLRNKGALIGAGIGAITGGAGNYFRKDKDKRSAKDALIGAAGGAGVGGLAGGGIGHTRAVGDIKIVEKTRELAKKTSGRRPSRLDQRNLENHYNNNKNRIDSYMNSIKNKAKPALSNKGKLLLNG